MALCSADSVVFPIIPPATTRNGLPDHADPEGSYHQYYLLLCILASTILSCNIYFVIYTVLNKFIRPTTQCKVYATAALN